MFLAVSQCLQPPAAMPQMAAYGSFDGCAESLSRSILSLLELCLLYRGRTSIRGATDRMGSRPVISLYSRCASRSLAGFEGMQAAVCQYTLL